VVDLERLPRPADISPEDAARGGEDYELLAAVAEPGEWTVIGRCEAGTGAAFLLEGAPITLTGFDHFR
jgi:thiamine monophosphate kinase